MNITRDFQSCVSSAVWLPIASSIPSVRISDLDGYQWDHLGDTWTMYEATRSGLVILYVETDLDIDHHSWSEL